MTRWYKFWYKHNYLVAMAVILAIAAVLIAIAGCQIQTSGTPQPNCPFGQHVERAKSHQGVVWQCVKG